MKWINRSKISLMLSGVLGLASVSLAAEDTWTKKADMPTRRDVLSSSVVDGNIYAIGGALSNPSDRGISTVEEYDPATDTWTRKADMPTARSGLTTSAVNGKIYAIGGWVGGGTVLSTVEKYDPNPLVVDFNGDGIVDCVDMCMMIDHWHTDEPLYDIAPPPFGDGVVDIQDLIVLAEYLFTYHGAVAYWKLDETEGDIAQDSIGVYDGVLNGVPTWLPTGGAVEGALQFDGIDDYVSTPFVLNPADGAFSVFAWIPGQVIIFQTGYPEGGKLVVCRASRGQTNDRATRYWPRQRRTNVEFCNY